jgi:hypothetical protein
MAQSKAQKNEKFDTDEVYPVTTEAPAQDDKVGAVIGDAGPEDSPVRTQRPGPADRGGHGRRRRLPQAARPGPVRP